MSVSFLSLCLSPSPSLSSSLSLALTHTHAQTLTHAHAHTSPSSIMNKPYCVYESYTTPTSLSNPLPLFAAARVKTLINVMASSSSCQQLVGASQPARLHRSLVLAISGEPGPLIHIQPQLQAPGSSQQPAAPPQPLHNPHSVYHQPPWSSPPPVNAGSPLLLVKDTRKRHTHTHTHAHTHKLIPFSQTTIQLEHKSKLKKSI